jgi:eukaryotic-like serine/threonine-protein kinase
LAPTETRRASGRRLREVQPLARRNLIDGRFRVERKIASGAMGEVWAGEHVRLKLRVALKVLRREALLDDELTVRFAREAVLLGRIHSDHVARVIDFVEDPKHGPVLVMEFVDGPSLAEVLRTRRLTVEEAVELGIDLANALRALHGARVVHRDVKPSNIIVRPLPDGGTRAVFVDLGVSRHLRDAEEVEDELLTEITAVDRALGTIEYMAPEQILSSRLVTAAADIYALGTVLFRAVVGRNVYGDVHGMDLARLKISNTPPPRLPTGRTDDVALGLEAAVARALACLPADRYGSADELLADLLLLRDAARRAQRTTLPPTPVPKKPASVPPPLPRPRTRRLAVWGWRAAALAAGLAAGAVLGASTAGRAATSGAEQALPIDLGACTVVRHADQGKLALSIVCGE